MRKKMSKKEKSANKNIHIKLVALLLSFLLIVILWIAVSLNKGGQIITINGNPVYEEEFLIFLKENQIQYEQNIRFEQKIPDSQSTSDFFQDDNLRYLELLIEQNIDYLTDIRVQQELALKYGGINKKFSYKKLKEEMNQENLLRRQKIDNGEVVYGLQEFSIEQYYSYVLSNLKSETIKALPDEVVKKDDIAVDNFYSELTRPTFISKEQLRYTIYDVSVLQTATMQEKAEIYKQIKGELFSGNNGKVPWQSEEISAEQYEWTSSELRDLVKQDVGTEQYLFALSEGEISEPFLLGKQWVIAQYNGFIKSPMLTENEKYIFQGYLQEQAYNELLADNIKKAVVTQNSKIVQIIAEKFVV